MPTEYLLKESRTLIELASTSFAGGGEGDLYKIKSPVAYRNYVAKLYHPHKISAEREEKTQYLIDHPPVGLSENGSIVWVKDALYTKDYKFVGFIMPFATGKKLELLCMGKLPKKIGKNWQRFDLKNPDALQYRLRICFNLAAAIYQMHATEHYVLVDMKPENILIQPNGLLAIVDTDSVEVIEDDVAIFPAPVATPEYTPPEFYSNDRKKNGTIGEPWDRFGLAVIFYKLLCGIHPFAGSANPPYDNLVSLHEKIEHGLFVHRTINTSVFSVIPPPHKQFNKLDPNLQELFIQCFEEGHQDPEARPTADEWCSALLGAVGDRDLEAHFAHIMGLWGGTSTVKIKMPSTLYRKNIKTIHPKFWLEERIEASFDSLPVLSIRLHQAIKSGKEQIQLSLTFLDYLFSGALFFSLFLAVLFFTSFGTWLRGDFWLSEVWLINVVATILMVFPLILFPRIISGARHVLSSERKLRKLWNRFRLTYPQLKQDVTETKRVLLEKILTRYKKETAEFERERIQYEAPLKKYLEQQDVRVKALMDERKASLEAISQKYIGLTTSNPLFPEMKGRSVLTLKKRLKSYYQKKLNLIEAEPLDASYDNYQNEKKALEEKYKAAEILLEKLVAEEKKEVDLVEANYATDYQAIYEDSEKEVLKMTTLVEGLNEGYKIEVNKLLATPSVEKIQISMKEKIQQAKKDIVQLEKLKL